MHQALIGGVVHPTTCHNGKEQRVLMPCPGRNKKKRKIKI
jgi:hypothetical protein